MFHVSDMTNVRQGHSWGEVSKFHLAEESKVGP